MFSSWGFEPLWPNTGKFQTWLTGCVGGWLNRWAVSQLNFLCISMLPLRNKKIHLLITAGQNQQTNHQVQFMNFGTAGSCRLWRASISGGLSGHCPWRVAFLSPVRMVEAYRNLPPGGKLIRCWIRYNIGIMKKWPRDSLSYPGRHMWYTKMRFEGKHYRVL